MLEARRQSRRLLESLQGNCPPRREAELIDLTTPEEVEDEDHSPGSFMDKLRTRKYGPDWRSWLFKRSKPFPLSPNNPIKVLLSSSKSLPGMTQVAAPPPNQEALGGPSYVASDDATPSPTGGQASRSSRPGQVGNVVALEVPTGCEGGAPAPMPLSYVNGPKFLKHENGVPKLPKSQINGGLSLPNIKVPPMIEIKVVSEAGSAASRDEDDTKAVLYDRVTQWRQAHEFEVLSCQQYVHSSDDDEVWGPPDAGGHNCTGDEQMYHAHHHRPAVS